MKRALALLVMIFGLAFYGWHTLVQRSEPHVIAMLIGAGVCLFGLWFALAPSEKNRSR